MFNTNLQPTLSLTNNIFISNVLPTLKLTSHGILYYEHSADIQINLLMLFSIYYMNIYFCSISYSID